MRTSQMPGTPASWYVALHRYTDPMGQGRVVQFKRTNDDLDLALVEVAKHVATPDTERRALGKLLSVWIALS